jgi:hypothetical protein
LVGLAAIGFAALLPVYLSAMNLLMHPECPASVRMSLAGLDIAATVIAFAGIHLARRVLVRDPSGSLTTAPRLWIGALSLWVGTIAYGVFLATHTSWSGVFDGWCHI